MYKESQRLTCLKPRSINFDFYPVYQRMFPKMGKILPLLLNLNNRRKDNIVQKAISPAFHIAAVYSLSRQNSPSREI